MKAIRIGCPALVALLGIGLAIGDEKETGYGQFAPPDAYENGSKLPYYGSENEWNRRMFTLEAAREQPNRRGQWQLLTLLDGDPGRAADMCRQMLAEHPDDLESLFVLTIAYCQLKEMPSATDCLERALLAGLPFERFLAGPRDLLRPLRETKRFQELAAQYDCRLLHGPMLGAMTDHSVRCWVRTATEANVEVRVVEDVNEKAQTHEAAGKSIAATDYTAVIEVGGLKPDMGYRYEVLVDGKSTAQGPLPRFRTFPAAEKAARFRVGFGGCAGYTPFYERMWDLIASSDLRAFMMLGDNVYIDLPEAPGPLHNYTYYCRQSRPEFRRLVSSTPMYAIWDDHDCAIDDVWMGPYRDKPSWKKPVLGLFRNNWNNPGYGDATWGGCWFRYSIADVDFFLLDGRYYRTNPYGPKPTMLGPVQKKWLLDGLKTSRATFKVIAAPVAWASGAKPGARDTWDGFPDEREEIFSSIESQRIPGVVLLSADRHRSEAWKIERPSGLVFYDLLSSRLTNVHTHECVDGALFCYNEKCSFGLLDFDTTAADPTVTYTIVSIDGDKVYELKIPRSQLVPRGS